MINIFSRELNKYEMDYLEYECISLQKGIKRLSKLWPIGLIILLIGIIITVNMTRHNKDITLIILAFVTCVIYCWIFFSSIYKEIKNLKKNLENFQEGIRKNKVEVLHCKSHKLVKIVAVGKNESGYCFQAEDSKILCLRSMDFQKINNFPSSDFEVVSVYGLDKKVPIYFNVYCRREKLKPSKVIPESAVKKIAFPKDLIAVVDGQLEEIEEILKNNKNKSRNIGRINNNISKIKSTNQK